VPGDKRWFIDGGRAGHVKYNDGRSRAEMEFEMLVGKSELVIYGERCRWTAPQIRNMSREEVRGLARELAQSMHATIDLSFSDSEETVRGGR